MPAYWKKPPAKITDDLYKNVSDINFGKRIDRFFPVPQNTTASYENRCRDLLLNILNDNLEVAAMTEFCGDPKMSYSCRTCTANDDLKDRLNVYNLRTLFDNDLTQKTHKELRVLASDIFDKLPRDPLIITEIENITKDQTNSTWWSLLRGPA